jgi:hypothetical protein
MEKISFKITGTTPLMLNNPQVVNPFNEYAKQLKPLTSKRKKTEDDLNEISKIKFVSALYWDENRGYYIPAQHFKQSIYSAAQENRLGKKVERSLFIAQDPILEFPDSKLEPSKLYDVETYVDIRVVGIMKSKITTTRPLFNKWGCTIEILYDETQLNPTDIEQAVQISGLRYGVGTYRKLYGRFEAEKIK